ncbi:MAG: hypothetical protein HC894_05300 [Microcoleus sp. SM1_3_4]|nr:hypothetical protein [Microcoleus sp. SM1_3_4]
MKVPTAKTLKAGELSPAKSVSANRFLEEKNRNFIQFDRGKAHTLPSLSSHRQPAVWRGSPGRNHDES